MLERLKDADRRMMDDIKVNEYKESCIKTYLDRLNGRCDYLMLVMSNAPEDMKKELEEQLKYSMQIESTLVNLYFCANLNKK